MSEPTYYLLLGVALGAIPSSQLAQLLLAWLGKRLGLSPKDIQKFDSATEDE